MTESTDTRDPPAKFSNLVSAVDGRPRPGVRGSTGVQTMKLDVVCGVGPLGFVFGAVNAPLFAAYIARGHRVARETALPGIDGLPDRPGCGRRVGISSSVIPYLCDRLAMRRLPRAAYALMVSLLPVTATVIGVVVLVQIPTATEISGVLFVILGVAIHREEPAAVSRSRCGTRFRR